MLFEDGRPLREVGAADLRQFLETGTPEYSRLDYKSELYDNSDRQRREFLLDICMFANGEGGVLLVGIPELRGEDGQPSGFPDAAAELGVESLNPQGDLQAYDARIAACVQDRLPIESHAIPLENGRFVFAFRVPNTVKKPHCVAFQGRVYFPSRRERHRYDMDLREIKEMTMRTASQMERTERLLANELQRQEVTMASGTLFIATMPIYHDDFLVDLARQELIDVLANFDVRNPERPVYQPPEYTFDGMQRSYRGDIVLVRRNGMVTLRSDIPGAQANGRAWRFHLAALDILIHDFAVKAQALYRWLNLDGPGLFQARLLSRIDLMAVWNYDQSSATVPARAGGFVFPPVQFAGWQGRVEDIVRPICDHVHQMFGRQRSQWFDQDGNWRDPRERQ